MNTPGLLSLLLAAVLAAPAPAAAAETPSSVLALWNRLPDLPQTAAEAAQWVDRQGALVQPGLLALQADIATHQQAIGQLQQAVAVRHQAQSAIATENLGKGMADVGIDMARAQRDPAYAQQVQERMRKMSPQELMAMSQKMSAPLNQDKRYQNAAQAMAEDPAPVRAAAEAGQAYSSEQMNRLQAQMAMWREAEAQVAAVLKKPLVAARPKPAMAWENIGCDTGCRAQWDAYADQMLPLMVARDTEVLRIRRAALQRHRAAFAEDVKRADRHLAAAQYGAASQSQVNQMNIVGYDGAVVAEMQQVLTRLHDTVKSAAAVTHCGKQIVLAPGAVCR